MSKFCTSCGAQLADDAGFCTTCGAQQNAGGQQNVGAQQGTYQQGEYQQQNGGNYQDTAKNFANAAGNFAQNAGQSVKQTFDGVKGAMSIDDIKNVGKTKNKNTIIGLAVIAVVLVIVIIVVCTSITPGYEKPIDNMCKAISKNDGKALANAFPEYLNDMIEDKMDSDYDDIEEYYEEELLYNIVDRLEDEYGENIKVKYKVLKKKEIKNSELKDLEDDIEDLYDEKVDVEKGYEVKVKMTVKGKDDDEEDTDWINVYKIDGKWCIEGIGSML